MKLPISTCLLLLLASGALNAPAETEQNLSSGNRTSLREQKRKIEYEVGGDGKEAKIEIQFENQTIKYESEFFLKVADIPRTGAKFVMKDNNTDAKFGFRVGLFKIAEINHAQGLFLNNSTNAINFFGNSTQYWSKIQTSAVGASARKFMTTYSKPIADTGKNVSVTLDAYVTQEQVVVDNMTLHPYGLKYGLVIENFPFLYSDSHLAVVKGITYKSSIQENYNASGNSLNVGGYGKFNWTSTVLYTDATSNATTEGTISADPDLILQSDKAGVGNDTKDSEHVESEGRKLIVFRTKPGNHSKISWDPDVLLNEDEISGASGVKSSAAMTTASVGLSLVAFFVAAFVNFL